MNIQACPKGVNSMIKLSFEQIVDKIKEKTDISDEEINKRIEEKMEQLAGLISKDGAAHIVANELKVNVFEAALGGKITINKLIPGMRNVEVIGKVRAVYEIREFSTDKGSGKVGSFLIADEEGMCRVTCWHAQTEKMSDIKEGDIVRIKEGYVRENNGRNEIHLNDKSDIEINPPGVEVNVPEGLQQTQAAAARKKISELGENDSNVELLGTIVQAFDPRFFEICPQCGKRAKPREDKFVCPEHDVVTPDYSYVMNVIIDDGSETIRVVLFRQQLEQLIGKTREQVLQYKELKELFDEVKIDLLGQLVKIRGRTSKNTVFDRLEFVAQEVDMKPDPKEELDRLNKELGNEASA